MRGKHGGEPKGKAIMVTWPNEKSHHDGHKNFAVTGTETGTATRTVTGTNTGAIMGAIMGTITGTVTGTVTASVTAVVDARAQTHYPAAMSQLATVIFRVCTRDGQDALLA